MAYNTIPQINQEYVNPKDLFISTFVGDKWKKIEGSTTTFVVHAIAADSSYVVLKTLFTDEFNNEYYRLPYDTFVRNMISTDLVEWSDNGELILPAEEAATPTKSRITLKSLEINKKFSKYQLINKMRLVKDGVWKKCDYQTSLPAAYWAVSATCWGHETARFDSMASRYLMSLTTKDYFRLVIVTLANMIQKAGIDNQHDAYQLIRKSGLHQKWCELGLAAAEAEADQIRAALR